MLGTKLGIFDVLRDGGRSAGAIAEAAGTDPRATEKLLNLLITMRYLRHRAGTVTVRRISSDRILGAAGRRSGS